MKRILALTLVAFAVPFLPGHPAVAESSPAPAVACPSDTPIAPPMGDVDQFVAFDPHGCPMPAEAVPAVVVESRPEPAEVPPTVVHEPQQVLAEATVTIPVEDGLVATTGPAEAEAASRPKPENYQQRLDEQYCAELPWRCSDAPFADLYG